MRLKLIHKADFRKNEHTLFMEALKENPELILNANECILLLSTNRKQLKFVFRPKEISYVNAEAKNGTKTNVLASELYRITEAGCWNPLMLANYAENVGIELEGLAKFASYYKHLLEEDRELRRKADRNRAKEK